ncbi:hypothetical protein QUA70_15260 [Microcoleus sp. LAD1_D5]|uniref:hypothetical protein n=1 Tax=unclassified Microcoleus TaxID=2642155 RepID=UPI002FD60FDE
MNNSDANGFDIIPFPSGRSRRPTLEAKIGNKPFEIARSHPVQVIRHLSRHPDIHTIALQVQHCHLSTR